MEHDPKTGLIVRGRAEFGAVSRDGFDFVPTMLTLANVARLGPREYDAAMGWLLERRKARDEIEAEREATQAEIRARVVADVESQHAANEEHARQEARELIEKAK
jgi:hypothetical protein